MNVSNPQEIVKFIVDFYPIFVWRGFPASRMTLVFEVADKFPNSRNCHHPVSLSRRIL